MQTAAASVIRQMKWKQSNAKEELDKQKSDVNQIESAEESTS
jgi:hypothetical protein